MHPIPQLAGTEWCSKRGIVLDGFRFCGYADTATFGIRIGVPKDGLGCVDLANELTELVYNGDQCDGGLFWVRTWGVWEESEERVGKGMFKLMCRGLGGREDEHVLQFWLSDAQDELAIRGMILLPLLFNWDAIFIASLNGLVIYVSHDEYVSVLLPDAAKRDALREALRHHSPMDEPRKFGR